MKKLILTCIVMSGFGAMAQTNRINHYSHSGKLSTLNIFKSNDNMGLGCGSVYKGEVNPSLDTNTVIWDSTKVDSNKVCTPITPANRMKAIRPKVDTSKVYNRGPK
ncbi:hypothetical protein [Parvicella tangerina]|uniref:Uncharacterized protein n=1 Tax=Parvicella tangerina TaxID=2829795 RepID=A0A916NJ20_9FLAO|nr:hypothetical protein [Parvicella tangerina]CAG5086150.1 hypothetical protein CRYO30217_03025 [Parvicella tangerina]